MAKNVRKERENIENEEGILVFWRKTQNKEVANNLGVPGRREARFAPKRPAKDSPRPWYPPSAVFVFSQWIENLAAAGGELAPNRLEACRPRAPARRGKGTLKLTTLNRQVIGQVEGGRVGPGRVWPSAFFYQDQTSEPPRGC